MMRVTKQLQRLRLVWAVLCSGVLSGGALAAEVSPAYEQVIAGRADKIVGTLKVDSEQDRHAVRAALLDFYRSVNAWHEAHGDRRTSLRLDASEASKASLAALEEDLATIRANLVARLSGVLPAAEIERVKDGLTYGVVHVTERAYQELLPELTTEQRDQIHRWLIDARDVAISEGSSEAKHGVFGRYKGRINNYLSHAGYDLKQAERDLQARRKAGSSDQKSTEKVSK